VKHWDLPNTEISSLKMSLQKNKQTFTQDMYFITNIIPSSVEEDLTPSCEKWSRGILFDRSPFSHSLLLAVFELLLLCNHSTFAWSTLLRINFCRNDVSSAVIQLSFLINFSYLTCAVFQLSYTGFSTYVLF
jgi:hypothetical protein